MGNHYAGNARVTSNTNDGVLYPMFSVGIRDITDGSSQTLAVVKIAYELGGGI